MAEGPDPIEEPLEDLEKEITCTVCQGVYEKAKLLPCNHYYCFTCIEKMAARSRSLGEPFHCPEFRKEAILPAGGAAELQPSFFLERPKDLYGKMAKAEGNVEAVCEQCAGAKCVAFCRQCAEFICGDCVAIHKKLKLFAGHVVAGLEDLKKGGAKEIPLKEAPVRKCSEHDKTLKLFCFDCERLICRDCTIIEHRDHMFEFLKKCAHESRKILRESLALLRKVKADMAGAEKTLGCEEGKVEQQKEEVVGSIQQSLNTMKAILDARKVELVKKAVSLAQEKKDALAAQKRVLHVAQKEVELVMELVERNVESTSDQDLMSIRKRLQTQMEEEEKRHRQLSLEPTATANISCDLPSPDVIPSGLGSVFDTPPVDNYTEPNNTIELGSPVQVTVCAPTASLVDVSATLKCVVDPSSSLEGEVVGNGVGIFNISVTPQVRGRHHLIVKVKGNEIEGSPFNQFVKLPPSQLLQQKPRKIGGFSNPWGIAINNRQQLVVAEVGCGGGKKITVMERDGKKVQTIECDQFKNLRGVAVASDGAIYVTDIGAKCLFKFNSNGKLLKTVYNELGSPYSVKIINNQLYVADRTRQQVKLFDTDCRVVGTIETKECPNPRDIAQGPDGLYVAGDGVISVYRCAPNGVFICHLNLSTSSLKLTQFWGVCFDVSGHIIVSDYQNAVCVFKPSGECVSHVSSDVIVGITVDDDGFVYVCSCDSPGSVLCF